ncbi:alpha/beta hydrolase [Myxococcaceae bacterium JPH2]|nr:alpha/beta hydrolase [Myxococcaceae bacterium JPH2]
MSRISLDPRIDPRLKAAFGAMPDAPNPGDVSSREVMLAELQSEAAKMAFAAQSAMFDMMDSEDVAPSKGLRIRTEQFVSAPDGNTVKVLFIRPDSDEPVPCICYLHGGAMQFWSAFDGLYRAWGRLIAAQGVAVAMIDFRNALLPSSAAEVAPFPAGLNDCVSGVKWVHAHAAELNVDASRVIVAGESGGGNLTLATGLKLLRDGDIGLIKGLYALSPYLAGRWPSAETPSSTENNGILLELHNNRGAMAYGIEAFEQRDPLAWPAFASEADVKGLPPTTLYVNECDPLRDEGVRFYRLLARSGVTARCKESIGTVHGAELFAAVCPDVSRDVARDLAAFAR